MKKMIDTYIGALQIQLKIGKGAKHDTERQLTIIQALHEDEKALLEEGRLPDDLSLQNIAKRTHYSLDLCVNDLKNFLFWRQSAVKYRPDK